MAGPESFAGVQPIDVGRTSSAAEITISRASFRHPGTRRQRCACWSLHAGNAFRRPARTARRIVSGASAFPRAIHGRNDWHDIRAEISEALTHAHLMRYLKSDSARGGSDLGRPHQDCGRAGDGAAGGADVAALVY